MNSRMKCVAKIMAMPGTRTAVADLCMFGLAACDDGGPGFVNASVRTITNARQVGVRLRSKCTGTHRHAQVNTNNAIEKEELNGNVGAPSRASNGGTIERGQAGAEMREQMGKNRGCKERMALG